MRKSDSTRRVLRNITYRDSVESKVKLGVLAEPYQGGSSVSVSISGNSPQLASVPRVLAIPTNRSVNSPVTVRIVHGKVEILSWSDELPYFEYMNLATTQSIPNTAVTQVGLNEDDSVSDSLGLLDADNSRLVFPDSWTGIWGIDAWFEWPANATGHRKAWIYLNGSSLWGDKDNSVDATTWYLHVSFKYRFAYNDIVTFHVRQSSGSALNLTSKYIYAEYLRG